MRRRWIRRWPAGWRMCAAAGGWRRSGCRRCLRTRRRSWLRSCWAGRRRRGSPPGCTPRAEGNPFFTEQLAAAMLAGAAEGELPARLAELLAARADRCGQDGRAVLAALAVAGRPLTEEQLGGVSGLAAAAVRQGLRELAAARLLADDTPGGGTGCGMHCWPRRWPPRCCRASGWCCTSCPLGRRSLEASIREARPSVPALLMPCRQ